MRRIVLLLLAMGIGSIMYGQEKEPRLVFKNKVHDFGQIKEDGGKVTHQFVYTNTGGKPLKIHRIEVSCGCTSPSWTRKEVLPGSKGYVRVTFDPRRRPGDFVKPLTVYSNATNKEVTLRIRGKVLPRKRTLAERYPRKMGKLRLKSHHLAFSKVLHNQPARDSMGIVNTSDQPMEIGFERVPGHVNLSTNPGVLKPGQQGYIVGVYDPTRVNDWGFRMDRVRLRPNGEAVSHNNFILSARIVENFSLLTEQERANAPHVQFKATSHDFGTVKKGSRVEHVFQFENTGKSNLKIRKIRATCGCTTVSPDKEVIGPGETSSFKTLLHVGTRSGQLHKSIYFISNDPQHSRVRLTLKAKVQ
jgi:hypothetical protein